MTALDPSSIRTLYAPAMEITEAAAAAEYLEALVTRSMAAYGLARLEAETLERQNLGYFAGYYDHGTRLRVERLFSCVHPLLGAAADGVPSAADCLAAGFSAALLR